MRTTQAGPASRFTKVRWAYRWGALLSLVAMVAISCGGDGSADRPPGGNGVSGRLNIEGSSTVAPYTRLAIEEFEAAHPGTTVTTGEKGSGAGITALIKEEVALAAASRKITADEIDQARANGVTPVEIPILKDALLIVVHPENKVEKLTAQQVAKIFAGQVTNWKDVGGADARITVYARNEESGTYSYMQEDVIQALLGKGAAYSSDINKQQSAPAGLTAVARDKTGIFYAGLGNIQDLGSNASKLKVLPIARSTRDSSGQVIDDTRYVAGDEAHIRDNSYPISRFLYYYSAGDYRTSGNHVLTAYIDYVLSDEGQKLGEELGFLPVD